MHEGLIQRLKENPAIDGVYFDAHGGFSWSKSKLHPVFRSREELLKDAKPAKAATKVEEAPAEAEAPTAKAEEAPKAETKKK